MVSPTRQTGTFAALLRRYRVAAGQSQEQLAEHLGLALHCLACSIQQTEDPTAAGPLYEEALEPSGSAHWRRRERTH